MDTKKYQLIFYLIAATIVATIGVQLFWNYKNYKENKQRVANEIQLSLDNAIEEYYASLAKNNYLTIVDSKEAALDKKNVLHFLADEARPKKASFQINSIKIKSTDSLSKKAIDSLMNDAKEFVTSFNLKKDSSTKKTSKNNLDSASILTQFTGKQKGYTLNSNGSKKQIQYFRGKKAADSLKFIKNLKPIFISFLDNQIEYAKLDSLINKQLAAKGIAIKTNFIHFKSDTVFYASKDTLKSKNVFVANSKSTYQKKDEAFKLQYINPNFEALKRSSLGIFLSLILSLLIISCLFYLLKIIKQQKELASIKNDLISNITHEFKTPIATISTAIEAIENFNVLDDKVKTKRYLSMSSIQLKKLHQMVEKLLETAMLDSEQLLLKKETVNLLRIIEKLVVKYQVLSTHKNLRFSSNLEKVLVYVDVFHFENVISNLIDNAIKYGGNQIEISVKTGLKSTEILIMDDGLGIEKKEQEKIFDQFYRIPKGNTHDVKGFGIGLYYCKKIIEKHEGILALSSEKKKTVFKITIPNE